MKILRHNESNLAVELRKLSATLSAGCGMVSADSREKTIAVFGEPLSPLESVRRILRDVRERGDDAIVEYTEKLDGAALKPESFRVSHGELLNAYESAPAALKDSLAKAKENIRRFQEHIRTRTVTPLHSKEGGSLAVRHCPLDRVGICVPGGRAAYPSTVLMTAIPAQVAGVREIAIVTPCGPDGQARQATLAAAHEIGVSEVYRIGGAQAVAALAYGTDTIPRVDKIVGPGNIFVTLSKREVYGEVGIDMLAGPSEILIIADSSANPRFIAADLLSQAEHDPAAAVLLTPDEKIAAQTLEEIEAQLATLPRGQAARDCLERYGFCAVTRDLDQAVELANQFAPEHLELAVENPNTVLSGLTAAGAIFVGQFTPESVGDYLAGPSHVLPTGGTARFCSGLSVNDFLRRMGVMTFSEPALKRAAPYIKHIARAEGLDAHARAVGIRFEPEGGK